MSNSQSASDYSILTIAIPTFNRSKFLSRCLSALTRCNLDESTILVLDNNSTDDTQHVLKSYQQGELSGSLQCIRNSANVGAGANVLRCFELASTKWLWIIGDDDVPTSSSVDEVLQEIRRNPACAYINFATSLLRLRVNRTKPITTLGISGFIHAFDCYSNLLFLTAGVYKRDFFLPHLPRAYDFIYSWSPHLVLLMLAITASQDTCCLFSPTFIADWEPPAPENSWSYKHFCDVAPFCVEVLPTLELKRLMLHKMALIADIAPPLTLRLLVSSWKVNESLDKHCLARYLALYRLSGGYRLFLLRSFILVYLGRIFLFRKVLAQLVKLSDKPLPFLGAYLHRLLDMQLMARMPKT